MAEKFLNFPFQTDNTGAGSVYGSLMISLLLHLYTRNVTHVNVHRKQVVNGGKLTHEYFCNITVIHTNSSSSESGQIQNEYLTLFFVDNN